MGSDTHLRTHEPQTAHAFERFFHKVRHPFKNTRAPDTVAHNCCNSHVRHPFKNTRAPDVVAEGTAMFIVRHPFKNTRAPDLKNYTKIFVIYKLLLVCYVLKQVHKQLKYTINLITIQLIFHVFFHVFYFLDF